MSFFLERSQLSTPDNINLHLEQVYEHLFPHSNWKTVQSFSLDGFAQWLPPIIGNSERIGFAYEQWSRTENSPFIVRFNLPASISKIGMRLILVDMIPDKNDSNNVNLKMSSRFSQHLVYGDRFGGVVSAAIGILKPQFRFLLEPPGRSCYTIRTIKCLGIENNFKPKALIYYE